MGRKGLEQQRGLTTVAYIIAAALLVIAIGLVFSEMAIALLSKFQEIISSV
ncbi:hypothetical protein L1D22_02990 [Vibrio sp. Isolate34]|uniref:hypothetical protein n=1 Tax=Vibrio sp. Isolate34 TaxID=2908540 RepID=UPI001EFEC6A3|nr:hypothetical protein [Vibrio sp. Isolate34]MCG9638894.1 hypothetical protein [Vibrio sp. Isolate34]